MKKFLFILFAILSLHTYSQSPCFSQQTFDMMDYQKKKGEMPNVDTLNYYLEKYVHSFDGCQAPELKGTTSQGKQIDSKKLKGKVTVLNFWFTHCRPCVGEFPSLNKLVEEYGNKKVNFISLALDKKEKVDSFLITHPLKYEVIADATKTIEAFKMNSYPINIVLDKKWRVIKILAGGESKNKPSNYERIKEYIEKGLAEK